MTAQRPRGLTPHLFVRDADGAVAFYRRAFGAAELLRTRLPTAGSCSSSWRWAAAGCCSARRRRR
jgi:uncharacterized glyoxalase superfamily protein PhnB